MGLLPPPRTLVEEIRAGLREGRISNATALAWMELALVGSPGVAAGAAAAAGEMSDEEADLLLPPRTGAEFERRARTVEARAAYVEDLPDEELYRLLFGDTTGDAG